ncbi:hypothetical protein PR002_g2901 [Phytophthora rubi]|uniref:Uncharacterized protein n=1 Tax=Phytophthora rubi TaxID=129364 RepID=A0A6A3NFS1_9STRA|nr:hypothetical protein PR002_g2901 [Phytophthora rubi]
MDFGDRELKYRDKQRQATVRLAKTINIATNTQSVVRVMVDAADGTTGIFVPKAGCKRHLLVVPTLDTVQDGMVRVAVLNIEGRREKLPARAALGTWVPT